MKDTRRPEDDREKPLAELRVVERPDLSSGLAFIDPTALTKEGREEQPLVIRRRKRRSAA